MSKIIAFVNLKGGCSKSSTSVHLAHWLSTKLNKKVLLIDAGVEQSSSGWFKRMQQSKVQVTVIRDSHSLIEELPKRSREYDYCIVDAPAGLAEQSRAILTRCNLVCVPIQPSLLDVEGGLKTISIIKKVREIRGELPKTLAFVSRAVNRTKSKTEAIALLSKRKDLVFLKTTIHQRQIIADAPGYCSTVFDLNQKSALISALEYGNLFKEIIGEL